MSFKDLWKLKKTGQRDSVRHKQRIREAIKQNLPELISGQDIITSKGNKKIKIPMRFLDMWRFKFGKNAKNKGVGHGDGDPGQTIAKEEGEGAAKGSKGGQEPGEEVYEEEVEIEEIIDMMLEDLELPWLEDRDNAVEIETEEVIFQDVAERGLPPNIDKKRTIMQNMKKNAMKGKMKIGGFEPDDLRYRVWENVIERHSNACVILAMDRSGSMTSERKYIVKSFFWWMVKFIEKKYKNVDVVFIAHDTEAAEVPENRFFELSNSGGTKVSSAFILANQIIDERYPSTIWNNYIFSFSDGDNWGEDNRSCIDAIKEVLPKCQAVGYGEVEYSDRFYNWGGARTDPSKLFNVFNNDTDLVNNERFLIANIEKREDVYECLKKFLKGIDHE